MGKLRNKSIEKFASEGKMNHMSGDEAYRIYKSTHKRMNKYKQTLAKREYYSHIIAGNLILNS